jgi:hypothetical protein
VQMPGLVVRAVTPADVAAVTRLQVASWHAAYAGIIPAGYLAARYSVKPRPKSVENAK